jgi:hypothetical protein
MWNGFLPNHQTLFFIIGIFGKILYKRFLFMPGPDDLEICLQNGSRWDQRQLEKEVMRITCVNVILQLFMTQYASVLSSRGVIFIACLIRSSHDSFEGGFMSRMITMSYQYFPN